MHWKIVAQVDAARSTAIRCTEYVYLLVNSRVALVHTCMQNNKVHPLLLQLLQQSAHSQVRYDLFIDQLLAFTTAKQLQHHRLVLFQMKQVIVSQLQQDNNDSTQIKEVEFKFIWKLIMTCATSSQSLLLDVLGKACDELLVPSTAEDVTAELIQMLKSQELQSYRQPMFVALQVLHSYHVQSMLTASLHECLQK